VSDQKTPAQKNETLAVHARPDRRSHNEGSRSPDLRDHELRVRQRRPRRPSLRAAGVRQHLHPDHEPDHRCLRAARRRSRGWRRGLGVASGQAAETLTILSLARAGDNFVTSASLYAAPTTSSSTPLPSTASSSASSTAPSSRSSRRRSTARPRASTSRPSATRVWTCRTSRASQRSPTSTASRSSSTTPSRDTLAPVRMGRGHHRPLGDQVDRWPRHRDRRRRRRQRQVRLGRLAALQGRLRRPGPVLPRRKLHGRLRQPGLHPQASASPCCANLGPALSPFHSFLFLQGLESLRCASSATAPTRWR